MVTFLFIAAAGMVTGPKPPAASDYATLGRSGSDCSGAATDEVLVCAQPRQSYRIDRNVLDASRAHVALPAKPAVHPELAQDNGCVGGKKCTGGVIPLVAIAEVAAKAAELAASGGDWRDALRIHEDEYRLYKEAEARKSRERRPRIGFTVGH